MMGLGGIVSDGDPTSGSLQGLAVAGNPFWKADNNPCNGGTGRAITENLDADCNGCDPAGGIGKNSCIIYNIRSKKGIYGTS